MDSTMQDVELLVSDLLRRGECVFPDAQVLHWRGGDGQSSPAFDARTFAEQADEAARLAGALVALGVRRDDVVATLAWNTPAHLAAYLAVPSMGAVLHMLNLRLSDDQLIYIVEHAQDSVILVDADLVPLLARILDRLTSVRHVVVAGGPPFPAPPGVAVHDYAELIAAAEPMRDWPLLAERSAAALCYTTGTTGAPKGVAYSHRSIYLHTLAISTGSAFGFSDADRVLPIVPMFHANAWGWPHAAWAAGADIVMIDRYLQAPHLASAITTLAPTAVAAVPTLWTDLDRHGLDHPTDFSSLRLAVAGGSAPSAALVEAMRDHHGVALTQGWGMTETSPLLTFSRPPHDTPRDERTTWMTKAGRVAPNVSVRVVDEAGTELAWDGCATGELELRGPTVTGSYFRAEPGETADKFRDGWLRTGDLGVVHRGGWVQLRDRVKDGIKSGGEWISTVEIEAILTEHADVAEVAVIGVPDARWEERPLVCVRMHEGRQATPEQLRAFLVGRVARWWLPERWAFVAELPHTSVGKLDKTRLRRSYRDEDLQVSVVAT